MVTNFINLRNSNLLYSSTSHSSFPLPSPPLPPLSLTPLPSFPLQSKTAMVSYTFADFIALSLLTLFILASPKATAALGVNWGTSASHPLPPAKVVGLLKSNNISKVKLFDTDSDVLQALSGSKILVTVGIPNSLLRSLNSSHKAALSWVHDNLTRYLSDGAGSVRIE